MYYYIIYAPVLNRIKQGQKYPLIHSSKMGTFGEGKAKSISQIHDRKSVTEKHDRENVAKYTKNNTKKGWQKNHGFVEICCANLKSIDLPHPMTLYTFFVA